MGEWRRWIALLRFGAGPLALLGFFLPWASGPGPYAATDFTGFTLVGFAGRLQILDLPLAARGVLWAFRLAILGVAVAAVWQFVLAPHPRLHGGFAVSGWYLVVASGILLAFGLARSGLVVPPVGFGLVCAGALVFLIGRAALPVRTIAGDPQPC